MNDETRLEGGRRAPGGDRDQIQCLSDVGRTGDTTLAMFTEDGEVIDYRRGPGRHRRPTSGRFDAVAHSDPANVLGMTLALRRLAARGEVFEAAMVFEEVPETKVDAKALGGIVSGLAAEGVIRCVGSAPSRSASRRGSLTRLWVGTGSPGFKIVGVL
jgi:hypothetical protein